MSSSGHELSIPFGVQLCGFSFERYQGPRPPVGSLNGHDFSRSRSQGVLPCPLKLIRPRLAWLLGWYDEPVCVLVTPCL